MQLMQLYVQKSIRTTLPLSPSSVSGSELIHDAIPANATSAGGNPLSTFCAKSGVGCPDDSVWLGAAVASAGACSVFGCPVSTFASDGVCVPSEAVWAAGACESLGVDCVACAPPSSCESSLHAARARVAANATANSFRLVFPMVMRTPFRTVVPAF